MANIPTILPKDIKAIITIPDEEIVKLVKSIIDNIVHIHDGHYNLDMDKYYEMIFVNNNIIGDIIFDNHPLLLIIYYQYHKSNGINSYLIKYLKSRLHEDEMFAAAIQKNKVPTDEIYLEDIIIFDEEDIPEEEPLDDISYVTTEQILHRIMELK